MEDLSSHLLTLDNSQAVLTKTRTSTLLGRCRSALHLDARLTEVMSILKMVQDDLTDPEQAISIIDLPYSPTLSPSENAIWSAALAMAITNLVLNPLRPHHRNPFFKLQRPSADSLNLLLESGFSFPSSIEKPALQASSVYAASLLYMPKTIASYSLRNEEESPLSSEEFFYWLPMGCWQDRSLFFKELKSETFHYRLGKSIGRRRVQDEDLIEAPMYSVLQPETAPFINAQLLPDGPKQEDVTDAMRASLAKAPCFKIPIRSRRLLIYHNTRGLGARTSCAPSLDHWDEQAEFSAVDRNGWSIPFYRPQLTIRPLELAIS